MTLSFTTKILHQGRVFDFLVEYDSASRDDNDIEKILYDGFSIDTIDMQFDQPAVYKQIEDAVNNNADSYWSDYDEKVSTDLPSSINALTSLLKHFA